VIVAEELHFGRAALSRQTKRLGKELGVLLFVSDRRSVRAEKGGPEPSLLVPFSTANSFTQRVGTRGLSCHLQKSLEYWSLVL
jgi:hypothetical protein